MPGPQPKPLPKPKPERQAAVDQRAGSQAAARPPRNPQNPAGSPAAARPPRNPQNPAGSSAATRTPRNLQNPAGSPAATRTPRLECVAGLAAARAVLNVRPQDVRHIAYAPEARKPVAELLRSAAQHRIAYRELPSAELDKLAGTLHHEGISLQVKARPALSVDSVIRALAEGGFALALDRVRNPHNIGALLRSAAYFGARALLIGGDAGEPRLTPAAVRTAEGGAEHVGVCFAPELHDALDRLARAGARIVGADAHSGEPLARTRFGERCVLVLGNEREGLSPAVRRRCASQVRIPGSGRVESLNVSVAAGILLAHAAAERVNDG
jgi:TrmH RNA methyltransferase